MAKEEDLELAKELAEQLGIDIRDLEYPHLTDVGNAKVLRLLHGTNLRYCWRWGCWLVWDGTRWRPDSTGQVYAWARDVARHYFEVSATLAKRADELDSEARDEADPDKRKQLVQRS